MGSATESTFGGSPKKPKRPKFLTDVFLPESQTRSDEVSFDNVRTTVERSFGPSRHTEERHHVVQDYLQLFDLHKLESCSVNLLDFMKTLSPVISNLNNDALCLLANIVTNHKVSFVRTRPRMKKIIKEYLPIVLADFKKQPVQLQQMSLIFRNPANFLEKHLTRVTLVTLSQLSAIDKTMKVLDDMSLQGLKAVNRELAGGIGVLQFPPLRCGRGRDELLKRVTKRCEKCILTLKNGDELPKRFSKALSVMSLYLKLTTQCLEIPTSEFFPFPPEIIALKDAILHALWSLPKLRKELKVLQNLIDPGATISKFRMALKKYLTECLFHCGDVNDIPDDLKRILAFINRTSRRRPLLFPKEAREEDIEAVLNVSAQLKQVVQNLPLYCSTNKMTSTPSSEWSESGDDSLSNDFNLAGNNYCSSPRHKSYTNDEEVDTGSSWHAALSASAGTIGDYSLFDGAGRCMIIKEPKLEKNEGLNALGPCPEKSTQLHLQSSHQESSSMRQVILQKICDDTSLFTYSLIGDMLDNYLQEEGEDVDSSTRYYLRGGTLPAGS